MSRFGYWRDPLFLAACGLYAVNRWLVKPHVHSAFLRSQFDDCLLIPCALPLILWLHRRLGLRHHDHFPSPGEISLHCLVWSVFCEIIGPHLMQTTGDVKDILAYSAGSVLAWLWWRWRENHLFRAA